MHVVPKTFEKRANTGMIVSRMIRITLKSP